MANVARGRGWRVPCAPSTGSGCPTSASRSAPSCRNDNLKMRTGCAEWSLPARAVFRIPAYTSSGSLPACALPGIKKAVIGAPALVDGADAENAPRSHLPDGERPLCHLLPSGGDQHSKTGNGAHCRRTSALRRLSFRGCSCARALSGPARGPCAAEPPLIGGDSPPVSGPDGDQIQIVTSRFRSVTKAPTGIEPVYTALQAAA